MTEKLKAPKLRFPGFSGDWEERKFGDICEITMGQSPDGSSYTNEPSDYILVQGNADLKDGWVVPRVWTTQKTKTAQAGDLIMSVRAPAGAMGKTSYDVVLGRGVAAIKGNEFIYQTLVKCDSNGFWKKHSSGSTFESLNSNEIKEALLNIPPSIEEQSKIGSYFSNLDRLISNNQRKLETLKTLKKAMLQKMFPKEGAKVPEIRFPEFSGDWEERKCGDMFTIVRRKNNGGINTNVITNSAEYGLIPQRDFFDKDIAVEGKTENYTVINKGDFVYNPRKSTSAPFGPFNCYRHSDSGIVSPLYTCLTPKNPNNTNYLLWYFKTNKWHDYIQLNGSQSGARHDRVGMTNELMLGVPISIPPSIEEQQKIGSYFSNLDNLISVSQRKLETLKNLKKGFLQQMFI